MRIGTLILGLVWATSLCGQRRFSWQDYCFNHSAAPFCRGRDYAIKPPAKDSAPRDVLTNPFPSTPSNITPSVIVIGDIDWRFADPFADALVGFNFSRLAASPFAHRLIAQLGSSEGLTDADIQKIFDALSGVDQVVVSVRDNRIVAMVTGRVTDASLLVPEAGLKTVQVSGNAMLVGHADAVDQAIQRVAMKGPPAALTRLAEERQVNSEFWVVGSAGLVGPQSMSAGVKRFSLTASIRDRLTSEVTVEFNGVPNTDTLRMWETTLGATTLEGNVVHIRMSMEANEMQERFGQIAASPVGQRLAALLKEARYLPVRDTTVPRQTKPVIYGLDGGPREVNQYPKR